MGRERADKSSLLASRELSANGRLLGFTIDAQPRMEKTSPKGMTAPGHDDEVTVDPELDSVRDLDGLFQQPRDRHLVPSVHVRDELAAHANLLRLRLRDHAFRRRQDQHAEILGREVSSLPLFEVRPLDGEPRFDYATIVDASDQGHAVQIPAAVLDQLERPDVLALLHHLQHATDQLRRGADHAVRLAGRLGVPHRHHGVVESVLQHGATSAVLPEAELVGNLAEALPTDVEAVSTHDAALAAATQAPSLPAEVFRPPHTTTSTLKRSFMNCMPSSRVTRCRRGIRRALFERRATRQPGRWRATLTALPHTPLSGSYFLPR